MELHLLLLPPDIQTGFPHAEKELKKKNSEPGLETGLGLFPSGLHTSSPFECILFLDSILLTLTRLASNCDSPVSLCSCS
jgi:hypothetical protein